MKLRPKAKSVCQWAAYDLDDENCYKNGPISPWFKSRTECWKWIDEYRRNYHTLMGVGG